MLCGLYLPNQAAFADPGVLASLAQEAEGTGWDWPNEAITPAEYEAIGAELAGLRTVDGPFDLVVIGSVNATWPSAASLGAYAAAGVTWALVQSFTVEGAMGRIRRGPHRSRGRPPRPHQRPALPERALPDGVEDEVVPLVANVRGPIPATVVQRHASVAGDYATDPRGTTHCTG
ncbi:MAG: hypothetical protein ACRD03_17905 [Acidimicrobiales bacterium]